MKLDFGEAKAVLEGLSISGGVYTFSTQPVNYEIEQNGKRINLIVMGGEIGLAELIGEDKLQMTLFSWGLVVPP